MQATVAVVALLALLARAVSVAAAPVHVFLLAGQSNAVGYGADANLLPPALYAPQNDIRFWFDEGPFFALTNPSLRIDSGDMLVPLEFQTDPSGLTFAGPTDGFGSEIKAGRLLADALPDIAIVKFAISGSSLAGDWNPATAGSLYEQMQGDMAAALAELADLGDTGTVAGVFWMQGEADAMNNAPAAAYEANLTSFIAQLRTDFGNPSLPFVFGRINDNIDTSCCFSFPYKDTVRTAQANVASAVSRAVMVDTDDLPLIDDDLHFTAAGQLGLGERFASAYLALPTVCGDGLVDVGEQCDDGNTVSGDCCSATCLFEAAGSSCPDDADPCTADTCSGAGTCAHTFIPNCPPEPDALVAGTNAGVRPGSQVRFLARPTSGQQFALPGPGNNPTIEGGTLRFFDTITGAGAVTYALPAAGWKGIGIPPGSKGFKYKGSGSIADPCVAVFIRPTQLRALCKGAGVALGGPFSGDLGMVLTAGTASKRYCASFGGVTTRNSTEGLLRKNAPPPAACPVTPP